MYLWLKAAHVASVLIFVGGVVALLIGGASLGSRGTRSVDPATILRDAVRRWDRTITLPAMFATWGFGIWIAVSGGWFGDSWLQLKLLFVFVLTGLHGVLAGRLRRLDLAAPHGTPSLPIMPGAIALGCIVLIAVLAIVRPF